MAKKRKNKNACSALKKTYRGTIRVDAVKGKNVQKEQQNYTQGI